MSDNLTTDILDGLTIPADVLKGAEAAPATPAAAPPTPDQPLQPAAAAPAVPAPVEPAAKQDHTVPLPTFLDMRDQNKELKRRLAEIEARPAPQIPSAATDPEAFARYQTDLVNGTRTDTVFNMSELMAREKHGDEPVTQAMSWAMDQAQTSPAFAAEYLKQKHPIDWAVKQQKRHALLTEMGDDPEAYIAKRIAAQTATPTPAPAQPSQAATPQPAAPAPAQPSPTRSLASAPNAGSATSVPNHPVAGVDAVFQ